MTEASKSAAFPAAPESARAARRFVADSLRLLGASAHDVETARLLTSEVVTNAFVHTGSGFELHVRVGPGVIRVEVDDEGAGGVVLACTSPEAVRGRGLHIVDALAHRWGSEHPEGGPHRVWFELQTQR